MTSRSLCRLGIGGGDVYGWWGFSRASKILFGCTVCSSFCSDVQCARNFVRVYSVLVILFGCTVCSSFCSGVQCARHFVRLYSVLVILFGCTVCSSFKWLLLENSIYV